jgi:hypothetical protein
MHPHPVRQPLAALGQRMPGLHEERPLLSHDHRPDRQPGLVRAQRAQGPSVTRRVHPLPRWAERAARRGDRGLARTFPHRLGASIEYSRSQQRSGEFPIGQQPSSLETAAMDELETTCSVLGDRHPINTPSAASGTRPQVAPTGPLNRQGIGSDQRPTSFLLSTT